jgi:hypothetical protein
LHDTVESQGHGEQEGDNSGSLKTVSEMFVKKNRIDVPVCASGMATIQRCANVPA